MLLHVWSDSIFHVSCLTSSSYSHENKIWLTDYVSFIEPYWMRVYNYINSTGLSFIYIHAITDISLPRHISIVLVYTFTLNIL